MTLRRENGECIGSFPCYGYKKDTSDYHKLVIDEEAEEARVTFLERKVTKRTSSQKDYKSSRIGPGYREDFEQSISSIVFRV